MKLKSLLNKFDLKLKIKAPFLEMDIVFMDADKLAAWHLYIELLTRVSSQPLADGHGDEQTALDSIYSLFALTRNIIKTNGPECVEFTKIAIIVLNQIIRPFTAKWHKLSIDGSFEDPDLCVQFREELEQLRVKLMRYTQLLSDMAGVEDLTGLEVC